VAGRAGAAGVAAVRCGLALLLGLAALGAAGCGSFGAERLGQDQVDYARALTTSKRRQILGNIVSLRYADSPSFLSVTQIIAGHSAVAGVTASGSWAATGANSSTGLGGSLSLTSNPTFTFTPTTGEELAESYIRPLAPQVVLPLAQSGVPIDLLMRLAVQSVGTDLQNSASLAGGYPGTVGFFQLIHALRRLQEGGLIAVRYARPDQGPGRVFLAINTHDGIPPQLRADAALVRRLLRSDRREVELVYGSGPQPDGRVAVVTRSVQGILSEIGAQIAVPAQDVARHAVLPTVGLIGEETRPTIVIHVGAEAPADAYADIRRDGRHYWIDDNDFDSKFAFSVVQDLIALAQSSQSGKQALVTIPATP